MHARTMVWPRAVIRRRDERFQQLALDSTIGQFILDQFEGWVETHGPEVELEREAVVNHIVDSARTELLNHGVPVGFHNNCLRLLQHHPVTGCKPPLNCQTCRIYICATTDYACNIKSPLCHVCASSLQSV